VTTLATTGGGQRDDIGADPDRHGRSGGFGGPARGLQHRHPGGLPFDAGLGQHGAVHIARCDSHSDSSIEPDADPDNEPVHGEHDRLRDLGPARGSAFQFSNTSSSPCTLYGYPGVSFVGAVGGSQIGAAATRNSALPAKLISLSPGQTVHATLQVVDAMNYPSGDCRPVTAHWLKIYPPNQTAPIYVSFTAQTCSKPKTILSVQTVQTGSSGS
jgi:Protein of unknown function (DUF4232)